MKYNQKENMKAITPFRKSKNACCRQLASRNKNKLFDKIFYVIVLGPYDCPEILMALDDESY